jgi:hypothetical protein
LSDATYQVEIQLSTKGNLASSLGGLTGHAASLDTSFANVGASVSALGASLDSAVDRAAGLAITLAKIGGAAIGAGLTYGVVKLNNELEKTGIALAAIFQANGITSNIDQGLGVAADVMAQMRKDAAELPGEFQDLASIFKTISVPGFQAGASITELRKLSAMAMASGAVMGLPMEQTGRELAMLMEGRAGAHNTLGMRLAGLGGDRAKEFNHLAAPERLAAITKELERFAPAINAYKTSFDGLSSTLVDNAKRFLSTATSPLFDRVKDTLAGINAWFDSNEGGVDAFAAHLGERIGAAYDVGLAKIEKWAPAVEAFAAGAEKTIGALWAKLPGDSAESKAASLAEMYGGAKLGAAGLGIAGGALSSAPLLDRLIRTTGLAGKNAPEGAAWDAMAGRFRDGVSGQFVGGQAGGLAELLANPEVLAAAGVAATALAAALVGIGGAFHAITDESSWFHDRAVALWGEIMEKGDAALSALVDSAEQLMPVALFLADALGTDLLTSLMLVATGAAEAANAIHVFVDWMAEVVGALGIVLSKGKHHSVKRVGDDATSFAKTAVDVMNKHAATRAGGGGGGGGTHIARVEITVTTNDDPSRIARLVYSDLSNLARHRTTSPDVRNFSAARP